MLIKNINTKTFSCMDTEAFEVKTVRIPPDENFDGILNSVLLGGADASRAVTKLSGHIRIPDPNSPYNIRNGFKEKDDKNKLRIKIIYGKQDIKEGDTAFALGQAQRSSICHDLSIYYKRLGLEQEPIYYTSIVYKGSEPNDWKYYDSLLIDFIDYILPYVQHQLEEADANTRADGSVLVSVDNLIYADHLFPQTGNPSFHLIYGAKHPYGFIGLWDYYLYYLGVINKPTKATQKDTEKYKALEEAAKKREKEKENSGEPEKPEDTAEAKPEETAES